MCIDFQNYTKVNNSVSEGLLGLNLDSGYLHDGRADKDSYPHDSNNQCIILRLQLSFVMIYEQ